MGKAKNRTSSEVKGNILKTDKTQLPSKTPTPTVSQTAGGGPSVSSYDIFLACIGRANNIVKLHKAAHGKKAKPEKYLADAHRAAVVLAISALDAFVRSLVVSKVRQLLSDSTKALPDSLCALVKRLLKEDGLFDAARQYDLLDRVEKALQGDFEKKSFQGTKVITEYLEMVGHKNVFHSVAINAQLNEDKLRDQLDEFTKRRHIIAHNGDLDLTENPPKEKPITKTYATDCIKLVTTIAKTVNQMG
ncbi:MAG: hypothetical protein FJ045_04355 [Crenarchaeota archaeon]|nr:hypothetical protein [Thermoproteota archaeon]